MPEKRPNILVYSDDGSTVESVRHCLYSLRRLLSPNYAVIPVAGKALLEEPWTSSCALLVMPGGADLAYCRTLNGVGNRRISQFVHRGGAYLGLCAGGYYGSGRCEFEVGDPRMEVVGDRELSFFPGTCRGLAFPGFVYGSDVGARASELAVVQDAFSTVDAPSLPHSFRSYYNGGGVFVDAETFRDRNVEILAKYTEKIDVDAGEEAAALVYCKIGDGHVVLSGAHPEFAGVNLRPSEKGPPKGVIDAIRADDAHRQAFLKACLVKMGLKVSEEDQPVPSLSRLHLSSERPSDVAELLSSWGDIITVADGEERIEDENDTFHLEKPSRWSMGDLSRKLDAALDGTSEGKDADEPTDADSTLDYNGIVKRLVAHESDLPVSKETPEFNHRAYFSSLNDYITRANGNRGNFGKFLMYGEVVTSTNTLLEKNPKLLAVLPNGFTATATTQVAGRGRGTNAWVSPPGALMFSTVIRHPLSLTQRAPVIFIQYLAAMAVVQAIRTYGSGYGALPVRLKWPNDIYALDISAAAGFISPSRTSSGSSTSASYASPILTDADRKKYVKIGGVLINSSTVGSGVDSGYTLVAGVGVNVANESPTTSLNTLAVAAGLPAFCVERLLARILTSFEELYTSFKRRGWDRGFQDMYHRSWLHTDQVITLESAGGVRARIKGVSPDWGQLLAEEVDAHGRSVGRVEQLQSDSNSFDFLKGLVRRKL